MRHRILGMAVAALLLSYGCRGSDNPTDPQLPDSPRFETSEIDCQMDPTKCAVILEAINTMKQHLNEECRMLGSFAEQRYNDTSGTGFRERPPEGTYQMSVYTNPPLSDGYTNVHPSFWTNPHINNPYSNGALVIHEEKHHLGASEAEAQAAQDMCVNPQA